MVGKRGYFFIVDAIIASVILLVGLFYLFSTAIVTPEQTQSITSAEDFSNLLMYQPLYQSTNTYYISTLLPLSLAPNQDASPLEEIAYLVFKNGSLCTGCFGNATAFTKSMMDESLDPIYGASVTVNGTLVYSRNIKQQTVLYDRPTIVYVKLNDTTLIGPAIAEVQLWY